MKVVKRDGQIVKFDVNKIMEAISGANRDVKGREKASIANKKEIVKYIKALKFGELNVISRKRRLIILAARYRLYVVAGVFAELLL